MSIDKRQIERRIILSKYDNHCAYCGVILTLSTLSVDHIKPCHRGFNSYEKEKYSHLIGENEIKNYNPSCKSCNSSKSTLNLDDWRKQIESKHNILIRDSSTFRQLIKFNRVNITKDPLIFYFETFINNTNG